MTDEKCMTVRDVAKIYNVTPAAVYNWLKAGLLPHYRFGGAIRLTKTHLREYEEKCTIASKETDPVTTKPDGREPTKIHDPIVSGLKTKWSRNEGLTSSSQPGNKPHLVK